LKYKKEHSRYMLTVIYLRPASVCLSIHEGMSEDKGKV
jgi:hypothetical protein